MMIGTGLLEVMGELAETHDGQFKDRADTFVFECWAGTAKIDKSNWVLTLYDESNNLIYDSGTPFGYDRARVSALETQLLFEMNKLSRFQADRDRAAMLAKLAKRPF